MKIAILSFTPQGAKVNRTLCNALSGRGFHLSRFVEEGLEKVEISLGEWTQSKWYLYDAFIFIGATGIAVRAIAPLLVSKAKDPAVVTLDEMGQYVIPLVSGHIGGANQLAKEVAKLLEALPIITTATDLEGRFAVDEWAKKEGLILSDLKTAKVLSASLLQEKKIGLATSFPIVGSLPEGLISIAINRKQTSEQQVSETTQEAWIEDEGKPLSLGIWIGVQNEQVFEETLWLIPPIITLGIGCKRGTSKAQIEQLVEQELRRLRIPIEAIKQVTSIDLKKDEEGLLVWANSQKKPIVFYSSKILAEVVGDFTASSFVAQVTGVENVCERAAVKGSNGGQLLLSKTSLNGVTMALAIEPYSVRFNE